MSNIKINNPWLLLIIIPLVIAILVGFFLLPAQKRKRPKNIISLTLHLVMSVLLGLAFADIRFLNNSTDTELYVVCDVSDSEANSVEKIDTVISSLKEQADSTGAKLGVITFGKTQYTLVSPGGRVKSVEEMFDDTKHGDFDRSCSDIAAALEYTYNAFSAESVKRVVLVSDGLETDQSAIDVVDELISNNVTIDCVGISSSLTNEVGINSIDYNEHCFLGREEYVKVMVKSIKETKATLTLTSGGSVVSTTTKTLGKGLNTVSLATDTSKVGTKDYEIVLTCENDTFSENNKKSFTQDYTDEFNVLFVANSSSEYNNFAALNLYTENTTVDKYINTSKVPYLMDDLLKYDEIVYSGINVATLNNPETLVNNLDAYVKVYGKSFLTFGATYSGSGEDYISTYNDMLPVQYESDEGKALAVVIDVSGSMTTSSRITKAKQGAIKVLDLLTEKDYVTIITFGDKTTVVSALTKATPKNKEEITKKINKIKTEGGTTLNPALTQAEKQLANADVEYKHCITLTDGEPSDGNTQLKKTVRSMASKDIVCTFINISNTSSSAVKLLKTLAENGNGSYYYAKSASSLVDVMLTSVAEDVENTVIEIASDINIRTADDPAVSGMDYLVGIEGYNYCRIKSAATTVLTVQYQKKDKEDPTNIVGVASVPLYAHWTYGKGKVGSFTSNLNEWTEKLRASYNGQTFFKQAATDLLPDSATDEVLDMQYENRGYTTDVTIAASDGDKTGKMQINVTAPSGASKDYELYYDGDGFSGTIETKESGKYTVKAKYTYSLTDETNGTTDRVAEATLPLYFDFSREYNMDTDSNNLLYNIAKRASGNYGTDSLELETTDAQLANMSYVTSMFALLIAAIILFLVDVFVRKSDIRSKKKVVA